MNYVTLYIDNSMELYCQLEWLANCVAKKVAKGKFISVEHLENCATVRRLISQGAKMVKKMENFNPGKEEGNEARKLVARVIIEDFLPYRLMKFGTTRKEAQKLIDYYVTI